MDLEEMRARIPPEALRGFTLIAENEYVVSDGDDDDIAFEDTPPCDCPARGRSCAEGDACVNRELAIECEACAPACANQRFRRRAYADEIGRAHV